MVFSSILWLCQTWLLTKRQRSHLCSWGARAVARTACTRRSAEENVGEHWRRMHRYGHCLLQNFVGSLDKRRLLKFDAFAGRLARSSSSMMTLALRTRCVSSWRFEQANHKDKRTVAHPKRFKSWPWEAPLVQYYGEASSGNIFHHTGWMLKAQAKEAWRPLGPVCAGQSE